MSFLLDHLLHRHHMVVHADSTNTSVGFYGNDSNLGELSFQSKYIVLTDCPAATDNSGVMFTGIDGDFCGPEQSEMPWSRYISL